MCLFVVVSYFSLLLFCFFVVVLVSFGVVGVGRCLLLFVVAVVCCGLFVVRCMFVVVVLVRCCSVFVCGLSWFVVVVCDCCLLLFVVDCFSLVGFVVVCCC